MNAIRGTSIVTYYNECNTWDQYSNLLPSHLTTNMGSSVIEQQTEIHIHAVDMRHCKLIKAYFMCYKTYKCVIIFSWNSRRLIYILWTSKIYSDNGFFLSKPYGWGWFFIFQLFKSILFFVSWISLQFFHIFQAK